LTLASTRDMESTVDRQWLRDLAPAACLVQLALELLLGHHQTFDNHTVDIGKYCVLAPPSRFHSRPQHDAMKIHGSHGAVFNTIGRPLVRHSAFEQPLQCAP